MAKYLLVLFLSSVKFAFTFPVAVFEYHLSFWETILITNVGAIIGILFFAKLSTLAVEAIKSIRLKIFPKHTQKQLENKKYNSSKKRKLIKFKRSYGFWGIVFLTPVFISTPIGTFLVVKYFKGQRYSLATLFASHLAWSVALTLSFTFAGETLF